MIQIKMETYYCFLLHRKGNKSKKGNRQPLKPFLFGNESQEQIARGTKRQFSENICSEDDLKSRIFGTFVEKFLACLPLLGFSNI